MYPLYANYPPQTRLPYLNSPITSSNSLASFPPPSSKPFLLYKGPLPPGKEEAFKIYPLQVNTNSASLPLQLPLPLSLPLSSRCSSTSSASDDSTTHSLISVNSLNSISSLSSDDDDSIYIHNNSTQLSSPTTSIPTPANNYYRCTHPDCRYKGTFLSKDYLRRHVREQHRRSREHVCRGYHKNGSTWGCNKKFSRPYQLVNHWKGQRSLKRCGVPEHELRKVGAL